MVSNCPLKSICAPLSRLCGRSRNRSSMPSSVEDFHRRGVNRVPPEIAEEIGMLFQHQHFDPGAGEQQPGHHPRRAAANDHDIALRPFAMA